MKPVTLPDNGCASGFRLDSGWVLAPADPGSAETPRDLDSLSLYWSEAVVPGTAALSIPPNRYPDNFDDADWWYRCRFGAVTPVEGGRFYLCFDGLATLAEVWLNGQPVLESANMYIPRRVDVTALLSDSNELAICFRSVTTFLAERRPRPGWKTNLVANQNLRWLRTTLLGRVPAWVPHLAPVGPWREVRLECVDSISLSDLKLETVLEGSVGKVDVSAEFEVQDQSLDISGAVLQIGDFQFELQPCATAQPGRLLYSASGEIPSVPQWWPHTHGEPSLLEAALLLQSSCGDVRFSLGKRGFKSVELLDTGDKLGFVINGTEVFCRGACWTINDIVSLAGGEADLYRSLELARDAGMNMLRVGGTMVYESDAFYGFCDELGILVWQDFMFASMDYPLDDETFHQNVMEEVDTQLKRLSQFVSLAVYCGNSEVQMQAAMMGASAESWKQCFFDDELPALCGERHPGIPYFSSTPCGGALPFHLDEGIAHYYGVGAFRRPLSDIGAADIKFASEAMGFSHVPEPATVDAVFNGDKPLMHEARWKRVVPRDAGRGLDFEDIRDYYLRELFKLDPIELRGFDPDRYLSLSRVVSGEMLYRVFALWRAPKNRCSGGLLWFYKDLVPGPGWGIIDSLNRPKAVYYALRRAFLPLAVFFEDRGLNGFYLNVINETDSSREVVLELKAYHLGNVLTVDVTHPLTLAARQSLSIGVDDMLGYFSDLTYAYQFGTAQHEVVHVRMLDATTGRYIDDDSYFPVTYNLKSERQAAVDVTLEERDDGVYLVLNANTFLQYVRLDLKSHAVAENYFHLAPNSPREIRLQGDGAGGEQGRPVKGYLEAINLLDPQRINIK